jgi:WD40 repeat protein
LLKVACWDTKNRYGHAVLGDGTWRRDDSTPLQVSQDGTVVLTCDPPGKEPRLFRVWSAARREELASFSIPSVGGESRVLLAPNGRRVVVVQGGEVKLLDVAQKTETGIRGLAGRIGIDQDAIAPDGKLLALLSSNPYEAQLELWEIDDLGAAKRRCTRTFNGGSGGHGPVFSPDSRLLALDRNDHTDLVDPLSGEIRQTLQGGGKSVFSPDGKRVATAMRGVKRGVRVSDTVTGTTLLVLETASFEFRWEPALVFAPNGRLLAIGSSDGTVRLQPLGVEATGEGPSPVREQASIPDVAGLQPRMDSAPVPQQVKHLEFSSDGKWLLAQDTGTILRVLDTQVGRVQCTVISGEQWGDGQAPRALFPAGRTFDVLRSLQDREAVYRFDLETGAPRGLDPRDPSGRMTVNGVFVTAVALSPDGKMVAAATHSFDGKGRLVLADPMKHGPVGLRPVLKEAGGFQPTFLMFTPEGNTLAVVDNGGVSIWDLGKGAEVQRIPEPWVAQIALWDKGTTLVTVGIRPASGLEAKLWDTVSGQLRGTIGLDKGHLRRSEGVAFSPDSQTLATVGDEGEVLIKDRSGDIRARASGHRGAVRAVAFAPDGKLLATGGEDRSVKLWKLGDVAAAPTPAAAPPVIRERPLIDTVPPADPPYAVEPWATFDTQARPDVTGLVTPLTFSGNGRTLAVFFNRVPNRGLTVWNIVGKKELPLPAAPNNRGPSFAERPLLSPDGRTLYLVASLRAVDLTNGQVRKGPQMQVSDLVLAPDGRTLVAGIDVTGPGGAGSGARAQAQLVLLDAATLKDCRRSERFDGAIRNLLLSPDGKRIAMQLVPPQTWRDVLNLHLVDADSLVASPTLAEMKLFYRHPCLFSPDGKVLAALAQDGVQVRDVVGDRGLPTLPMPSNKSLIGAFIDGGRTLVLADDTRWQSWDVRTGQLRQETSLGTASRQEISTDGLLIASAEGSDGKVVLWDARNGRLLARFETNQRPIIAMAISPNRRYLATLGQDGMVKVWKLGRS